MKEPVSIRLLQNVEHNFGPAEAADALVWLDVHRSRWAPVPGDHPVCEQAFWVSSVVAVGGFVATASILWLRAFANGVLREDPRPLHWVIMIATVLFWGSAFHFLRIAYAKWRLWCMPAKECAYKLSVGKAVRCHDGFNKRLLAMKSYVSAFSADANVKMYREFFTERAKTVRMIAAATQCKRNAHLQECRPLLIAGEQGRIDAIAKKVKALRKAKLTGPVQLELLVSFMPKLEASARAIKVVGSRPQSDESRRHLQEAREHLDNILQRLETSLAEAETMDVSAAAAEVRSRLSALDQTSSWLQ